MDTDEEFTAGFEAASLAEFHHADHIRIAWIYLRAYGYAEAERRMASKLRNYAASKGAFEKYHETMTRAWMRLVAAADVRSRARSFPALVATHPELLDQRALYRFYSPSRLALPAARSTWVEPDLEPLPTCLCD